MAKKAKKESRDIVELVAEAPAAALDKSVRAGVEVAEKLPAGQTIKRTKAYWHILGPGLTTGAADDDPSGIATYSQTGAKYGFQLLWTAALTFPLMAVVQEMCARIGLVTGRGLAGNIRSHFSQRLLYLCTVLLVAANTFNIGADLGAMAKGAQLLTPHVSFSLLVIGFALLSMLMQIYTPYDRYAKYLKWLALILLAYVASALMAHLNWHEVAKHSIAPSISWNKDQILLLCAILGTTISPYLFFWQTSQEVERAISRGQDTIASRQGTNKHAIRAMRIDVWSGMLLSNLVMFFIIAASGAILFSHGHGQINSAADAAEALRPFAGNLTYLLFTLGIVGTGLLAIPVLAGANSYALSESRRWRGGLNDQLGQAKPFYGVIMFSILLGLALNFVGLDPIKALIYSAVANGIVAPLILGLIVLISSSQKTMGEWVNKPFTTFMGWLITGVMTIAGAAAIVSFF